jgi:hypothetical protein
MPSTIEASQPDAIEAQDALQIRKPHLDLLTLTPRPDMGIGRDVARNISACS